jgi:hypothetical protein
MNGFSEDLAGFRWDSRRGVEEFSLDGEFIALLDGNLALREIQASAG